MKPKTIIFILGVLLLTLFIFTPILNKQTALAEEDYTAIPQVESVEVTPIVEDTQELTESAQILQQYVETEILTTSANQVDISASNFRIEENQFKADICFQTPTKDEWQYFGAHVFFANDYVVHMNGGTTFSRVTTLGNGQTFLSTFQGDPPQIERNEIAADSVPNYRCDTIYFNLGEVIPTEKFELKIDALILSPSESEGCLQYGEQVREALKQKELNITFECEQGQFGSKFVVTSKPESLSQEEALNTVYVTYVETLTLKGPWIFSGELASDTKIDLTEEAVQEIAPSATAETIIPTP